MKPGRRMGAENAKNRTLLVEAAGQLLVEEGYASLTARKVAEKAGLKVQLVYYYFQTMDDLILELVRSNSAKRLKKIVGALAEPDPLRGLWVMNRDLKSAISSTELLALANHRENIRTEIVARSKEMRGLQVEAVQRLLADRGVDTEEYPAAGIVAIVTALTRAMAQDTALGVHEGYDEAVALVERVLAWLTSQKIQPDKYQPEK